MTSSTTEKIAKEYQLTLTGEKISADTFKTRYCPVIKNSCKKEKCIFWRNGDCIIAVFIELMARSFYIPPTEMKKLNIPSDDTTTFP